MFSRRAAPRVAPVSPRKTASAEFPRGARLTRAAEFERVFAEGRRRRLRHFVLIYTPGMRRARLGLAVGRRASARAVVRNRIKRIVRESFRHARLPPLDIVVVALAGIDAATSDEIRAEIDHALGTLS